MSNSLANIVGILSLAEKDDDLRKKMVEVGVDVFGDANTFGIALTKIYADLSEMEDEAFNTLLSTAFRDNLTDYKAEQEAKGNEA